MQIHDFRFSPTLAPRPVLAGADTPAAAPVEERVGSGPAPGVDLAGMTRVLTGKPLAALSPAWQAHFPKCYFFSSGQYDGPGMLVDSEHVYAGDASCFRKLNQSDGGVDWELKLPEDESLKSGDPILCGRQGEIICLRNNTRLDAASSRDGLIGIDSRTGEVRFRSHHGMPHAGAQADRAGNLYYGNFSGQVVKLEPDGNETVLNPHSSARNILQIQVRPDGSLFYTETVAREARLIDGVEDRPIPVEGRIGHYNSLQLTPDGGALCMSEVSEGNQRLTSISPQGEVRWTLPVASKYFKFATCPDGGAIMLLPGDRDRQAELQRVEQDGTPGWKFTLDDPALHSGNWWSTGWMNVRDNGDLVLIEPDNAVVLCLKSDGQEKWRRLPEEFPHSAYWPKFSFTPDDHMIVLNRGGVERYDLETGRNDLQFCAGRNFVRRWDEQGNLMVDQPVPPKTFDLQGLALQGNADRIYTFDYSQNLVALALPRSQDEVTRQAVEEAGRQAEPVRAGQVTELNGFMNVGGVLLPRRRQR